MAKIKVYQCKSWNDREAMWKVNRGFFKREAIDAMTGTHIVPETCSSCCLSRHSSLRRFRSHRLAAAVSGGTYSR
jgi:hypothetical protein